MATVGDIDVNLDNIKDIVNSSTLLGQEVTLGVADQGGLIGLAIGLLIALGLLFVVIFKLIDLIPALIGKVKGLQKF